MRAYGALRHMKDLLAQDVFTFHDTLTDADTEVLAAADPNPGGFTIGNLTTKRFAAQLPPLDEFERRVAKADSIAIVGSGASLNGKNLGSQIDAHLEVCRFNDLVGSNLNAADLGSRST